MGQLQEKSNCVGCCSARACRALRVCSCPSREADAHCTEAGLRVDRPLRAKEHRVHRFWGETDGSDLHAHSLSLPTASEHPACAASITAAQR
eukprot:1138791-Pelagomonas_calceolata.AAC.5